MIGNMKGGHTHHLSIEHLTKKNGRRLVSVCASEVFERVLVQALLFVDGLVALPRQERKGMIFLLVSYMIVRKYGMLHKFVTSLSM